MVRKRFSSFDLVNVIKHLARSTITIKVFR